MTTPHPMIAGVLRKPGMPAELPPNQRFYRATVGRRRPYLSMRDAEAYDRAYLAHPVATPESLERWSAAWWGAYDARMLEEDRRNLQLEARSA